jgi:hypothetical protein
MYICLAYGSREQRIAAMLNHKDTAVAMYAKIMQAKGYLTPTGVVLDAKSRPL